MNERILVPGATAPQGCCSPAVRAGEYLFVAGQGPIEPASNEFRLGTIDKQTRLILGTIRRILEGCSASLASAVKCTVFLADVGDFAAMNRVHAEFFGQSRPATLQSRPP